MAGCTERIKMEMIMDGRIAGTARGTERYVVIASRKREVKGRIDLIGPAIGQAFDIPLIGLDLIRLADECISRDMVDLLYP